MKTGFKFRSVDGKPEPTHGPHDYMHNRLSHWSGVWPNDGTTTFSQFEEVWWEGAIWVCREGVTATLEEPSYGATDWQLKIPSGGRGAMTIDAAKLTLGTIGLTYQPIDEFDSVDLTAVGINFTLATGQFSFDFPGIWDMRLTLVFSHNESNQGRETRLRLYNVTDSVAGPGVPWFIGRNQPGSSIFIPFPLSVSVANVGKQFRCEIGGGDSITVVDVEAQAIDAFQLSPVI